MSTDSEQQFPLLPTPRSNADRTSRKSMVENRQWSAPSLSQAVELMQGILPREFASWAEVPGWHKTLPLLPMPQTSALDRMDSSSTQAIRASRSAKQADGWEKPTPATCGPMSSQPFAYYDPQSSSLRTSHGTFDSDSTPCSPTLPPRGSMRNGDLYERPTSARHISGQGSSLLPTPTGDDASNTTRASDDFQSLARTAHLLPTPRTTDAHGPGQHGNGGMDLRTTVNLLPTPTARDDRGQNTNARKGGPDLPSAARLLPTPTAGDSASAANKTAVRTNPDSKHHDGTTLASWHGASMSPPSDGGSTSSDDQRPGQLTIEDA